MEYRFNAEEWKTLSTEQKVRRCRLMAQQAQTLAAGVPARVSDTYIRIANDWLLLAEEITDAAQSEEKSLAR